MLPSGNDAAVTLAENFNQIIIERERMDVNSRKNIYSENYLIEEVILNL